jgi:sugar phosphate permease
MRARIPAAIWALGLVSMFMDISSEMIHSLLPMFLATTLGVSATAIGLIEGLAEATALIVKVFSGVLSDWLGKRKGLALLGYALGAVTKPFFALANGAGLVVAARLVDRVGKGIRGAPRDALVADLSPPEVRGAAFGLRQSLDTVGAFVGPLLATAFMLLWADDFRAVFWVAVVPGVIAVLVLALGCASPSATAASVAPTRSAATRCARWGPTTGGWWRWAACSPWPASARPSWCCGPRSWACPWLWCRW